jgi:hypothetical protein
LASTESNFGSIADSAPFWEGLGGNSPSKSRPDSHFYPPAAIWSWIGLQPRLCSRTLGMLSRHAGPKKWMPFRLLSSKGAPCGLARFLDETGLELEDVYAGNKSWSDLCADAGLTV